ncbi:MAG: flagellar basal body-associated FliL family protein [Steroidobacteraceae bacterium]
MANAPATDDAEKGEAQPGSKKKLIIIGAAVVVIAGGAAAFFLTRGGDDAAKEAEHKEEPKLPAEYIAMDPPFVVNFDNSTSAKFLQVTVQMMTRSHEMAEFIKGHDPVIRNDLLLMFGAQKVEEVSTREGKEKLRQEALEAIRAIIKNEGGEPEKLEAVYFTSFVMQ